jgi:DNA-binding transcriptional LysR family regulator
MEIRQIKSFLSVAETLHFGKSSQLLHLSQPALSLQIKALEDELGVKLLDRDRQGTKITPAGLVFKVAASKIMEVRGGLPPDSVDRGRKTRVNSTWIHFNSRARNNSINNTPLSQAISSGRVLAAEHSHQ